MRYTYVTSKSYPLSETAKGADHIYVRGLVSAYAQTLGEDFSLIVKVAGKDVADIQTFEYPQLFTSQTINLSFFLIRFIFQRSYGENDFFLSNDFNLVIVLGVFRLLTRKKYKIIFDPHLLLRSWKDKAALKFSDLVITTSDELKRQIVAHKIKNVFTVYGGVSTQQYVRLQHTDKRTLRKQFNLPVSVKLVGYVGGFTSVGQEKGLDTLIKALKALPKDFHILLAGGTQEQIGRYREYAKTVAVEKRTHFLPFQDRIKIPEVQYLCDVLVIPYPDKPHFRDFGFPMKVFEYLATGNPIVYSKLPIIDDFMCDKGFPFIPGDYADLAKVILRVVQDGVERKYDINKFSWKAKAKRNVCLMRDLVKNSS